MFILKFQFVRTLLLDRNSYRGIFLNYMRKSWQFSFLNPVFWAMDKFKLCNWFRFEGIFSVFSISWSGWTVIFKKFFAEAYLGLSQISEKEIFWTIVNVFQLCTISAISSISDVWLGSECSSASDDSFCNSV